MPFLDQLWATKRRPQPPRRILQTPGLSYATRVRCIKGLVALDDQSVVGLSPTGSS